MAAADVERSVDSAIDTFNELDGIFSLKEYQTTALYKAYVEKKDVFFSLLRAASSVSLLSKPIV
jgi:hypothetical protein